MTQNYTSYQYPNPNPYPQNYAYSSQPAPGYQVSPPPLARPYVNPIQAIKNWFKYMFHFSGRASRSEFWWVVLTWWILDFLYDFIVKRICWNLIDTDAPHQVYSTVAFTFMIIKITMIIICLVSMVALHWRRLHDVNVSGKCYLLFFIPLVGLIPLIYCICPSDPEGVRFDAPDDATRP